MDDMKLEAEERLGGCELSIADNKIVERSELSVVSLAVPTGGEGALTESLKENFGLAPPEAPLSNTHDGHRLIRTAPDQMLLIFPGEAPAADRVIRAKLGDLAYLTDQTDAWVILEVHGPETLNALARICMIDLDATAFPVNSAARTMMEHLGVLIIRLDVDSFLLMSAASSAESFLHAVETSYRNVVA